MECDLVFSPFPPRGSAPPPYLVEMQRLAVSGVTNQLQDKGLSPCAPLRVVFHVTASVEALPAELGTVAIHPGVTYVTVERKS